MSNTYYCSFVSIHYIICECGDTFPTEEALKEHLENDHKTPAIERNEYQCSTCFKVFSTEKACLIHQHVHTRRNKRQPRDPLQPKKKYYTAKNIVCEVCGKRYASNAALRYHQRVHTGERPYQCALCPKNFTMPLFLQIHIRTHTGERPYECPMCPKAFSNKAALLRHDRVHSGIKPYECPQCGKFFTQSNSMKLHVKTVHLKMPAPYKSKSRRAKQAMRQGPSMSAVVKIDEDAFHPEVGLEVEESVYDPEVKTEATEYEQESEDQGDEDQEQDDREVYRVVYHDDDTVKVEVSEMPMYEQDIDQPEVLYEEVYEMDDDM